MCFGMPGVVCSAIAVHTVSISVWGFRAASGNPAPHSRHPPRSAHRRCRAPWSNPCRETWLPHRAIPDRIQAATLAGQRAEQVHSARMIEATRTRCRGQSPSPRARVCYRDFKGRVAMFTCTSFHGLPSLVSSHFTARRMAATKPVVASSPLTAVGRPDSACRSLPCARTERLSLRLSSASIAVVDA